METNTTKRRKHQNTHKNKNTADTNNQVPGQCKKAKRQEKLPQTNKEKKTAGNTTKEKEREMKK